MTGPATEGNRGPPGTVSPNQPDQANPSTYPATGSTPGSLQKPRQHSAMRSATVGKGAQQITSGMDVQSRTGQPLGTVADVIKASSGDPAYIVIADESGSDTAVPYSVARHMVRGSRIVVDDKQLRSAPKVPESQLQNPSSAAWKGIADNYWASQPKDGG
jgi:PRC-barrel domain